MKVLDKKIFGLGYNLLVFVYEKKDSHGSCKLKFTHCLFIEKERTADFITTKHLIEILKDGANKEDIIGFLQDRNLPSDKITYDRLDSEIMEKLPKQGDLTISNALQWRLQYSRVNSIDGIISYEQ